MKKDSIIQKIKEKWNIIFPHLNEKAIRLWAASEALAFKSFESLMLQKLPVYLERQSIVESKILKQDQIPIESEK